MKKLWLLCTLSILSLVACKKEANYPDGLYASIETDKGTIVAELFYEKTPLTVANFVSLAEGTNPMVKEELKNKKFYDGLKFHRVIADFMIQGGDPEGSGAGGPGYTFVDEFVEDLKHDKAGVLSMANAGPATNGSQFFITHKATPHLDNIHTVFGQVIEGQDVVNKIAQDDVIKKITIIRMGDAAKNFDAAKVFEEKMNAGEQATQDNLAMIEEYRAKATTADAGVSYYVYHSENAVQPKEGEEVRVYYAGYLTNGKLFDTNIEEVAKKNNVFNAQRKAQGGYEPFPFKYGQKEGLIPGFIVGIENMKIGEKSFVFIPTEMGYGANGAGAAIPPNADLIFEIQLVK